MILAIEARKDSFNSKLVDALFASWFQQQKSKSKVLAENEKAQL
jgi:hypothetical protein